MRFFWLFLLFSFYVDAQDIVFRANQVGYLINDSKSVLLISQKPVRKKYQLVDMTTHHVVFEGKAKKLLQGKWGSFEHQYIVDFSLCQNPGSYYLQVGKSHSRQIIISDDLYAGCHQELISFMQHQRCGYNPYFDVECHQKDGKLFDSPIPDSTYMDFSGGWHDAGDQLKYLITGSNATARMLMAYQIAPGRFGDRVDALGHPFPNGIPDILDEAKWGLDWILKLHPKPNWLIHQIADDRDHRGFKFPDKDNAEYGWGPNTYRPAYFATGKPQGLGQWKSKATGISNLAGRCAAALAMGARIWTPIDQSFADRCKKASIELYKMGMKNEGFQQGNSYGAPYRYNEDSWEDDMEWGAVELYKLTGEHQYLKGAIHYANLIQDDGWMARDTMLHYQKYPFMNMGHFALYHVAPDSMKKIIEFWYRQNIEKVIDRSNNNAYNIGVPFLWCSNNLMVNFITQVMLYEKMTGDLQYHDAMILHRDWLFGRNPWGTSMFTGIPEDAETPVDVHLPATFLLKNTPPGGLIDGPIYRSIHTYLKGLTLTEPDEFAAFQNDYVVYHDDIGDYATNEPTMDGTADAILMIILLNPETK